MRSKLQTQNCVNSSVVKLWLFIIFVGFIVVMIDIVPLGMWTQTRYFGTYPLESEFSSQQKTVSMNDNAAVLNVTSLLPKTIAKNATKEATKKMEKQNKKQKKEKHATIGIARRKCDGYMMKGLPNSGTLMFDELITATIETIAELYPEYIKLKDKEKYRDMNRLDLIYFNNNNNINTIHDADSSEGGEGGGANNYNARVTESTSSHFSSYDKHHLNRISVKLATIMDDDKELLSQINKTLLQYNGNDNVNTVSDIDFNTIKRQIKRSNLRVTYIHTDDERMKQSIQSRLIDGFVKYVKFKHDYNEYRDNNINSNRENMYANVWDTVADIESSLEYNLCYFAILRDPRDRLLSGYNKITRHIAKRPKNRTISPKLIPYTQSKDNYTIQFIDEYVKKFQHHIDLVNGITNASSIFNNQIAKIDIDTSVEGYNIEKWFENIEKKFKSKNCCIKSNQLNAFYENLITNKSAKMDWINQVLEFFDFKTVLEYHWNKTKEIRKFDSRIDEKNGNIVIVGNDTQYIDRFDTMYVIDSIMQANDANRYKYVAISVTKDHKAKIPQVCNWQKQLLPQTQEYVHQFVHQKLNSTNYAQFFDSYCN